MRALVTGAEGFVGRHLVAHLRSCGDDVVGTDRSSGGPDLLDHVAIHALVTEVAPDVVYHLAGAADVGGSWTAPTETFRANAEGTLHVLHACVAAEVGRVVAISSADVYGKVTPAELPLTEESPLRPVSPYAASKVAADYLGVQAHLGYGLDVLRVRAFNHLGPGQSPKFVAAALAERIVHCEHSGTDEVPVGNLSARRDVTDVRDVVRAYRLLAEHGTGGEAYNVCTGRDVAVQDIADGLAALATRPVRLVPDPDLERPVDVPVMRGSCAKLVDATGWSPEIPLEQTLADVLASARERA